MTQTPVLTGGIRVIQRRNFQFSTMQRTFFALDTSGKPRLSVVSELLGGAFAISLDRKQLGDVGKREELETGVERELPDGTTVRVQSIPADLSPADPIPKVDEDYVKPILTARPLHKIVAWRNGQLLPLVPHIAARENIRNAMWLLVIVGVGDLILGFSLLAQGGVTRPLITGPIFFLAAWALHREKLWGASLGLGIAVADLIINLMHRNTAWDGSILFSIVARILVILWLQRALNGLREIEDAKKNRIETR